MARTARCARVAAARACGGAGSACSGTRAVAARERLAAHCLRALLDHRFRWFSGSVPHRLDGPLAKRSSSSDARLAPEAEHQLLRVLRQEARTRVDHAGEASALRSRPSRARRSHRGCSSCPTQANGDRGVASREVVAEQPQLRRRARRHQHDVGVAVAVEVEDANARPS